jgi:prepilin-type N-terminal cleavage/methylation domain-containing protein
MPAPRKADGFTLIEMMIGIALGSVVAYTAYAGFRMASQSIVVANRLSLENSLMRAGYIQAHQQIDFWTNLDDPYDASRERLRLSGMDVSAQAWATSFSVQRPFPTAVGLPFAPMNPLASAAGAFPANIDPATGATASSSSVPRYPVASGPVIVRAPILPLPAGGSSTPAALPPNWENDAGFDPSYAWSPHDPRTWFRGNPIEKWLPSVPSNTPATLFGHYGGFTNVSPTPAFSTFPVSGPYPPPPTAPQVYRPDYRVSATYPPHLWYGRQLLGLSRAIGFYGLCDYLPANAMYGYYVSFASSGGSANGTSCTADNLSYFFNFPNTGQNYAPYPWQDPFLITPVSPSNWAPQPGGGAYWNFVGQGMCATTLGLYALTSTSSYAVSNPYGDAIDRTTIDDNTLAWRTYSYSNTDYSATYNGAAQAMQCFIATTLPLTNLMASAPSTWPSVSVGVGHYVKSAHFVNLAKIRWVSPLTGQTAELSFDGIGTTLRGARMQRKPGSAAGWAAWDNAAGAANDPNLDGPQ